MIICGGDRMRSNKMASNLRENRKQNKSTKPQNHTVLQVQDYVNAVADVAKGGALKGQLYKRHERIPRSPLGGCR